MSDTSNDKGARPGFTATLVRNEQDLARDAVRDAEFRAAEAAAALRHSEWQAERAIQDVRHRDYVAFRAESEARSERMDAEWRTANADMFAKLDRIADLLEKLVAKAGA